MLLVIVTVIATLMRANCASQVTFGVFRYAWRDLWGTIHLCA